MYNFLKRQWFRMRTSLFVWLIPHYHTLLTYYGRIRYRSSYIEERWSGTNPCAGSTSTACFVHYDYNGLVPDYVLHYLAELTQAGFRVQFCSNAPRFPKASLERIRPFCENIYRRKNHGYDFGAYKELIREVRKLDDVDRVLIANDSVYGPFGGLQNVLDQINLDEADVWGISDSWEFKYHLHSFFFVLNKRALTSPAFEKYWNTLPFISTRSWVIQKGEIGFTQAMLKAQLRVRAVFPYEDVVDAFTHYVREQRLLSNGKLLPAQRDFLRSITTMIDEERPLNATHYFWEILIGQLGYPFIKRDLLEKNPGNVPGLRAWRHIVTRTGYDTDLITRHLRLRVRNKSL